MLGYYYGQLYKKQDEVRRLNACNTSLTGKQSQFNDNEYQCTEPELSASTWQGSLAISFDDIRETGIHTSYIEIAGSQFTSVYTAISDKLTSLNTEIESFQRIIESLEEEAREKAKAEK
ncbi:MAG: DUF5082 domain-containing protein [Bacillus sp. (in: Bacteria)]|nr:DUF5082 domain-containing protein [Bacillus sp. (in: firmicutes)]